SKCTAGVPPARGRPAGREDEGGRDARGTLWATHLLTCTRPSYHCGAGFQPAPFLPPQSPPCQCRQDACTTSPALSGGGLCLTRCHFPQTVPAASREAG
ncbi:MAG: hypothetical protein ABSE73_11565, partial [Planctomycetota bacterium]